VVNPQYCLFFQTYACIITVTRWPSAFPLHIAAIILGQHAYTTDSMLTLIYYHYTHAHACGHGLPPDIRRESIIAVAIIIVHAPYTPQYILAMTAAI